MPGGALPSSGSLGPRFPAFLGTTAPLRLLTYRLESLRFSLASRYSRPTLSSLSVIAVSFGAPSRGLLYPGSPCPSLRESRLDLPSPLASPLDACPALGPRWVPLRTAAGAGECCLPVALHAVGSPRQHPISGLYHAACILAPPGFVLGSLLRTQDSLPACRRALAGWDFPAFLLPGHPLGGSDGFHRTQRANPPVQGLLGANSEGPGGRAHRLPRPGPSVARAPSG